MRSTTLLPLYAALASCSPVVVRSLSCKDVSIPVHVSAQNKLLPPQPPNLTDPKGISNLLAALPTAVTEGSYTIAARYCESPTFNASKPLQVLVHGATYDRNYWSGLAAPGTKPGQDKYSWIEYAAKEGYTTLSIDRLCNGKSSMPNGLNVCQQPFEAETIAAVIRAARKGSIPDVDRSFLKVIFVGHSFGSQVGNHLSIQHPEAADALLLTGWSNIYIPGVSGPASLAGYQPAKLADLNSPILDPTYLKSTSKDGIRAVFYDGDFSEDMFNYDFTHRGTCTSGESYTSLLGQQAVPAYKGPVFVLNGNKDLIFCSTDPAGPAQGRPGDCLRANVHNDAPKLYPNARTFGYHFTEGAGHCLNMHENAQESFKAAHDWLATLDL